MQRLHRRKQRSEGAVMICDECLNNEKCDHENADICKDIMSYIENGEATEDE
jgi:hypothetical protein